jgi:ABC-2 type transport system ATP-binding protein
MSEATTKSAISFSDVSYKINHVTLINNISLSIQKGSIAGILGSNGAGKSTLLSLLTGLRTPTAGKVLLFDKKQPHDPHVRQNIGVVLQETALYEDLTIYENLNFSASLYHVPKSKERIAEILALLDLSDRTHDMVRTLSGGLQRRVAIARAFLHEPELLIIDEPTLGVDVEARHAIWSHLRLLRSKGRTIVVATNYLDEAQALCDTVAILQKGKLVALETPQALVGRVGSCIDLTCTQEESTRLTKELEEVTDIIRVNQTPSGLSIFVKGNTIPEKVIKIAAKHTHLNEFRVRAPDLAEVFNALQKPL